MKIILVSLKLALATSVIVVAIGPTASRSQSFGFPGTISSAGALWYVSDNMSGIVTTPGDPGPGGFGFSDAEFATATDGIDAYDGGFLMRINGTLFKSPGNANLSGSVLTSATGSFSGIDSQVQFTFYSSRSLVRALYSFTNPSQSPINATLRWEVNLGSDAATTVAANSGDSGNNALNRWLVTTDGGNGDLVNTLVRWAISIR
jgi:hypothetical protein